MAMVALVVWDWTDNDEKSPPSIQAVYVCGDQVTVHGQPATVMAKLHDGTYRVQLFMQVDIQNPLKMGPRTIKVQVQQFQNFEASELSPRNPC